MLETKPSAARRTQAVRTISKLFLFMRVFLFAAAVPYLMRLKLTRLAAVLEPGSRPRPVEPERIQRISAYLRIAIARGRPFVRPGCLTLGLTRYYFFRRAGLDVSLRFGMGRVGEQKELVGHCWLVKDSEPFLENQDPRPLYTEIYRISREDPPQSMQREMTSTGRLTNS